MAAARLLKMSKPLGLGFGQEVIFSNVRKRGPHSQQTVMMCLGKAGLNCENPARDCRGGAERKPVATKAAGSASAYVIVSEPKIEKGLDLSLLIANISDVLSHWMKFVNKQRPWRLHVQTFVEKAIIDCRFFAMLAVAGSSLGSVLCFVEGCFLMLESYFQYFHAISRMSGQGHVVLLLIEAIDMFLVGTAMLIFGTALHVMFVGSNNIKSKGSHHPSSAKNFNLEKLPSWMGMGSVMEAKSKMGHALIMILQVEVLEKCKSIPMTNGLDLACLAGAIFLSSASIFLLSRIAPAKAEATR